MSQMVVLRYDEKNQEATVWVGGLEAECDEELVWELMIQAGPVLSLNMPRDKVTGGHQGFAFVEYASEIDADYAIKVMNMIKVYGKPIRVNKASKDHHADDIGANLFVGNLDPEVDDKMLYDTFSAFGVVTSAHVMRSEDGSGRGIGFVNFDGFEASDSAIENMNGQYICNRPIHVSYAYKKDGSKGERHGAAAERLLASNRAINPSKPHTRFSAGPAESITMGLPPPALPLSMVPGMPPNLGSNMPPQMQMPPPQMPPMMNPPMNMMPPHGYFPPSGPPNMGLPPGLAPPYPPMMGPPMGVPPMGYPPQFPPPPSYPHPQMGFTHGPPGPPGPPPPQPPPSSFQFPPFPYQEQDMPPPLPDNLPPPLPPPLPPEPEMPMPPAPPPQP